MRTFPFLLAFSCVSESEDKGGTEGFLVAVETGGEVPMFTWGSQNMNQLTVTAQSNGAAVWSIYCQEDTAGEDNCLTSPIAYGDQGYFSVEISPVELVSGESYDVVVTGHHSGDAVPDKVGEGSFTY
jgi:hypothetical protein